MTDMNDSWRGAWSPACEAEWRRLREIEAERLREQREMGDRLDRVAERGELARHLGLDRDGADRLEREIEQGEREQPGREWGPVFGRGMGVGGIEIWDTNLTRAGVGELHVNPEIGKDRATIERELAQTRTEMNKRIRNGLEVEDQLWRERYLEQARDRLN